MALTDRTRKKRPEVARIADPQRVPVIDTDTDTKKQWTSKDRKTIKVDPDVKSLIEIFSDFDGTKEYETLRKMADFYFENNYDERAQRIISNIQSNKFIS
jgi:hypothetical protein